MPLLAIGLPAVLAIISIISSIAMAVYSYQQQPGDPGGDGSRMGLKNNRARPGNPSPLGGGMPRWAPPLFSRTLTQPNLDSRNYEEYHRPTMRLLFDTGIGPMDGGDLSVWLDDTPIFYNVNPESPLSERRLIDVTSGTRKQWFFPKNNVQKRDARVYIDGKIHGIMVGDSLEGIETKTKTIDTTNLSEKTVPSPGSPSGTTGRASYIDIDELATNYADTIEVWADPDEWDGTFASPSGTFGLYSKRPVYKPNGIGLVKLTKDQYTTETAPDGKLRVVLTQKFEKWTPSQRYSTGSKTSARVRQLKAKRIKVQYKYAVTGKTTTFSFFGLSAKLYHPVEFFTIDTNKSSLRSKAVFKNALPSGEVTGTYKTLPFGVEIKTFFAKGDLYQQPIPLDYQGQSRFVGLKLGQGIDRRYSTTVPVDNFVVGIASGPGGFWREQTGVDAQHVKIRMWFKEKDAPDVDADTFKTSRNGVQILQNSNALDPSTGWVPVTRSDNREELFMTARIQNGLARWAFDIKNAYKRALLRGGVKQSFVDSIEKLPRKEYEIKAFRVTKDDTTGSSELFIESVTENVWEPLSFPRRSFLLVEYKEQEGLESSPQVDVQFKMRKCRKYLGTFAVSREEQLGRWIASNGGNSQQITLADGTIVTTGGGLLDTSAFVYDPDLTEPRFELVWTRNPVWIATEFIIGEVSGGGAAGYDSRNSVDWESALRAANYCDEIIDGEVRSEADWVLTKRVKLYDAVSQVLAGSGVAPAFSRGKWYFPIDDDSINPDAVIDKLTGEAFTITDDDILDEEDGNVTEGLIFDTKDNEGTATDLEITFPDEDAAFDQDADPVFIPANDDSLIRNVRRASFPAVRRRSQVERVGNAMMTNEENNKRVVTVKPANFRTIILDPGDVILFGSATAQVSERKAQVIERVPGGSNLRQGLKLLLLDGAERVTKTLWQGPNGGVIPGTRTPSNPVNNAGTTANSSIAPGAGNPKPPKSGIVKVEEL